MKDTEKQYWLQRLLELEVIINTMQAEDANCDKIEEYIDVHAEAYNAVLKAMNICG